MFLSQELNSPPLSFICFFFAFLQYAMRMGMAISYGSLRPTLGRSGKKMKNGRGERKKRENCIENCIEKGMKGHNIASYCQLILPCLY